MGEGTPLLSTPPPSSHPHQQAASSTASASESPSNMAGTGHGNDDTGVGSPSSLSPAPVMATAVWPPGAVVPRPNTAGTTGDGHDDTGDGRGGSPSSLSRVRKMATAVWPPGRRQRNQRAPGVGSYTIPTFAPRQQDPTPPRRPTYKGFSTSICDLFRNDDVHREDCCALACCGILSHDKSRYLATGEEHSSILVLMLRHVLIPLTLFLSSGLSAIFIGDRIVNEVITAMFFILFVSYLVVNCALSFRERVAFRKDLIRRVRERNDGGRRGSLSSVEELQRSVEVDKERSYEANCAHACCCGFYSDDTAEVRAYYNRGGGGGGGTGLDYGTGDDAAAAAAVDESGNDHGVMADAETDDACTRLWRFFADCCCSQMCGCWFQFCGCCAIAQEAREVRMLLPREDQMIDFVTYEPFVEFRRKLEHLRSTENNNLFEHYGAISQLSRLLIRCLILVLLLLLLLAILDLPKGANSFDNLLVVLATFCQAWLILYFVHWKWNRFDLSVDAVVKYFASGFLLTTGLALFFELVESFVLQFVLIIIAVLTEAPSYAENGASQQPESITDRFAKDHPVAIVMYLFLNSFALAALVEELCKYFGFIMLEHPDFSSSLSETSDYSLGVEDDSRASGFEESSSEASPEGYAGASVDNDNAEVAASQQQAATAVVPRSLNSIGAGVTVAMVAVAMGFACCENLIYIFLYTGGGAGAEFSVLLLRSIFPVHPLAAAIQSIGVCRRDLEGEKSFRTGMILFPAVLLHGSFDFALMFIGFLSTGSMTSSSGGDNQGENNQAAGVSGVWALASFLAPLTIVLLGVCYYIKVRESKVFKLEIIDALSWYMTNLSPFSPCIDMVEQRIPGVSCAKGAACDFGNRQSL